MLGTWRPLVVVLFCFFAISQTAASGNTQCSVDDSHQQDATKNHLQTMEFDVGDGPQSSQVYIIPDVVSMYQDPSDLFQTEPLNPAYSGFQGKFCNLSNETYLFSWVSDSGQRHSMQYMAPWTCAGMGTDPDHTFVLTPIIGADLDKVVHKFYVMDHPNNLHVYDPYRVRQSPEPPSFLSQQDQVMYLHWRKTLLYNQYYKAKTGRTYLANFLRPPPMHWIWPADYFGQEHWIITKESHFTELPPSEKLTKIHQFGKARILRESRLLAEYRETQDLNLTLRVISVAPRILEIDNFLSPVEVSYIVEASKQLEASGLGDKSSERTEYSLERDDSPILDAIYRRAADVQRVDEALLRERDGDERPDVPTEATLAENLRIVHYAKGEEYPAHTDFSFRTVTHPDQVARFSTLLVYLNEPELGGETHFPRWVNAESRLPLAVRPKVGKALLIYSQLPDGNFDDLTFHSGQPVEKGEKWIMNLWLWDPLPL